MKIRFFSGMYRYLPLFELVVNKPRNIMGGYINPFVRLTCLGRGVLIEWRGEPSVDEDRTKGGG